MARLSAVSKIRREDVPEAPDWFGRFLGTINSFFENVVLALNGRLTFADNIQSQTKVLGFTTSSTYISGDDFPTLKFQTTLPVKAQALLILQIQKADDITQLIAGGTSLKWFEVERQININFVSGLEDSTDYTLRVLLF